MQVIVKGEHELAAAQLRAEISTHEALTARKNKLTACRVAADTKMRTIAVSSHFFTVPVPIYSVSVCVLPYDCVFVLPYDHDIGQPHVPGDSPVA